MLRKKRGDCQPNPDPIEAPDYTEADVQALRACSNGNAAEDQQKRAIEFIINDVCATYDMAFRPGSNDRQTNLAMGRQRAGQIIVWFLNQAPTKTAAEKIQARLLGERENG